MVRAVLIESNKYDKRCCSAETLDEVYEQYTVHQITTHLNLNGIEKGSALMNYEHLDTTPTQLHYRLKIQMAGNNKYHS